MSRSDKRSGSVKTSHANNFSTEKSQQDSSNLSKQSELNDRRACVHMAAQSLHNRIFENENASSSLQYMLLEGFQNALGLSHVSIP